MDIFRMIGIAVVMIVPTFVLTALLYVFFPTIWMLLPAIVVIAILYSLIVTGKFSKKAQTT
ncbi:hypothetical protein ACFL2O_10320 [Thermodesulfobacteriota bacterium]